MPQFHRLYFLDHLRAFVVVLVVVLHGSMTYMSFPPDWWYVVDPQNSLFFTALVLLIDIPIMLILFFISGYFALPSLWRRGPDNFFKEKLVRIGVPWLVGVLFFAPPIAYMIFYSRGTAMSLLQFWTSDFWTAAYQQSVYWYLGMLLFLYLALLWVFAISARLRAAKQQVSMPGRKALIGFWALSSLAMFLANRVFPMDSWHTGTYLLVFQPVRFPLYITYFALGCYAYLHGWFTAGGYKPRVLFWMSVWLLSGALYLWFRLFVMPTDSVPLLVSQIIYAVLFNAFCLSSLLGGAAFFQRKLNRPGRFWNTLSVNSYGIYYVHPLILYPLAFVFVPVDLPLFVKAPLVILSSILISWAVSALVLTRLPVLRRAFG